MKILLDFNSELNLKNKNSELIIALNNAIETTQKLTTHRFGCGTGIDFEAIKEQDEKIKTNYLEVIEVLLQAGINFDEDPQLKDFIKYTISNLSYYDLEKYAEQINTLIQKYQGYSILDDTE